MSTPPPKKELPKLLEFKVDAATANELAIKVKNISGAALDKTLAIEIYPPMSLVSAALNDAAIKAPDNEEPPGALRLDGTVTGPTGWSLWARRESSDSTMVIVLINDRRQDSGAQFTPPIAFPVDSETTIRIPLNPNANKDNVQLSYGYTHGNPQERRDGTLDLNASQGAEPPVVLLYTTHPNPTMVTPGDLVSIRWNIKDGVSATLFGPLPGDNAKVDLEARPDADFKLEGGSLTVRVVGLMNYVLQAEVKRAGKENLLVSRTLTLDTANNHHVYINPRQRDVLPYGLIELDWAAWGVSKVIIRAGSDTTRAIQLTQQTFGGSYEGSGVMRLSAPEKGIHGVSIDGGSGRDDKSVTIVKWKSMTEPDIAGIPLGLAMVGSKLGLLTFQGLYIAEVGKGDPQTAIKKLPFVKKTDSQPTEWIALTAVGNKFLVLKRTSPDLQVAAYNADGTPDAIPPLSLPPDVKRLVSVGRVFFDLVGFGGRAYIAIEAPISDGRRAYSVAFNSSTNKADVRPEPLLESLPGYRLTTFDDALYALHRDSGRMFRFELTRNGTLGPALQAASAVKKINGQDTSMIRQGLIVPVGRALVVLGPTSVPSLASLEQYDLHNVLRYESSSEDEPDDVPQDLFYTPQKNYWGRCGHDLNVKAGAVAVFRDGGAPRLWVIQPNAQTDTLAVGSESLFVRDYVLDFPTKPLSPYINKRRRVTIKHATAVGPIADRYRKLGIMDVATSGPRDILGMPTRPVTQFDLDIGYNEANPATVSIRLQLARRMQSNPDVDYLLEVILSGPDLSTVTSFIRRVVAVQSTLLLSDEEVYGSRVQHPTGNVIDVPKPARLDEVFGFMIANTSKQFRVKTDQLRFGPTYVIDTEQFAINSEFPGFLLKFDGRVATEGVVNVDLNWALPLGIEVLGTSQPQTKLVRITNDRAKNIQVKVVTLWKPGDPPVKLEGSDKSVKPESPVPVFICQLDYKM